MGRIILTRHPNGEPQAVAGWDEPLYSYFFQVFDDKGEAIYDVGANRRGDQVDWRRGRRRGEIMSIPQLRISAGEYEGFLSQRAFSRLKWHKALRDSDEVIDLTETSTPPSAA